MNLPRLSYQSILQWILPLLMLLIASGCDTVLQYPDDNLNPGDADKEVTLRISADTELSDFGEFEYDLSDPSNSLTTRSHPLFQASKPHHLRFIVRAFDAADKSPNPAILYEKIIPNPGAISDELTVKINLPAGDYRIVVWADYVDPDSSADKYYLTSEFAEIALDLSNGHYGSNDYRDAFFGETSIHIPAVIQDDLVASILLRRPLAKYTFVSTDLKEFLEEEVSRGRKSDSDAGLKAPQLSDYQVRIVYTRYMPSAFNIHNGKPADSRTGVEYRSLVSIADDNKARLAFDYIFTPESQTSVAVAMEVIHKSGIVVSRVPSFDIPIKRSMHTVISGSFLTTKTDGAIGINPDFNGEFNIEIK